MKQITYSIFTLIFFCGCRDTSIPFEVSKNGTTITLPGYLSEEELADDAFIEYANRYRNFYLAGFELPLDISIDSAKHLAAKRIYSSLEKHELSYSKDQDSNVRISIQGQFKGEPESIYYYQKIIEKSNKRYLLTLWMRGEERHKKYIEDIEGILYSFKIK